MRDLLSDLDPWVGHMALKAFTQFAETTPHEDMVPACLAGSQKLQDKVVAYLSKVRTLTFIDEGQEEKGQMF